MAVAEPPGAGVAVDPPRVHRIHRDIHGETLEHRLQRQRPGRTWHNPYADGLPDTPELIQALTQGQRDRILAKMARAARA